MAKASPSQSRWTRTEDTRTHSHAHLHGHICLLQRERVHTSKAMSALSDSVKLVQKEGEASRRHLSNVLHAEVTVR